MGALKTATFTKSDSELVKLIEEYQRKNELNSFSAIRKLCKMALTIEKMHNEK